jgi:excinuclease UvrABC nuclease subunit
MINHLKQRFLDNGSFKYRKGDTLSKVIEENKVPDKPGVYLIFGSTNFEQKLLYIGRAGTIKNNGTFSNQKLEKRLKAKQSNKRRQEFFKEVIEKYQFNSLEIYWFVTHYRENKILPSLIEAELIQEYYNSYLRLPPLNKEA